MAEMLSPDPDRPDALPAFAAPLKGTRPWVRFMSVVVFVSSGLMIGGGLLGGAALLVTGDRVNALVLLFLYPLMGVLYIYPGLCLFRYGTGIGAYLASRQETDLERALDAQRMFWKFVAILTAASIGLAVIGVVFGVVAAVVLGLAGQ